MRKSINRSGRLVNARLAALSQDIKEALKTILIINQINSEKWKHLK